jgi:hypothetical protein
MSASREAPTASSALIARARAHLGDGVPLGNLFTKRTPENRAFLDGLERGERAGLENAARTDG